MTAREEIKSEALFMWMFESTLWTEILRTVGNTKKLATGGKGWPFHCFEERCFENRILFLQPSLPIPWGTETSFQWLHKYCPSVQIDLYSSLGPVIPSIYPLLHCTYWMSALAFWTRLLKMQLNTNPQIGLNCCDLWPARWPVQSQLASCPLRGCTGKNGIKGLAKKLLEDHQWFCCWKHHTFGSYYVAGHLKCVICSWYQSQWNYQLWIIYVKNSGSLHPKC